MKMKFVSVGLCVIFAFGSQCTPRQDISEENVARIIETLSSDSLRGRSAFSSDIRKAADFIAAEFAEIGLQPIDDEENYLQEFTIYSVEAGEGSVFINGVKMDPASYFARVYTDETNWTENDVEVFTISKNDNLRSELRNFLGDSSSSVVLIDEEHHEWFNRYRRYFKRPSRTFNPENEFDDVFILTTVKQVNSLKLDFKNKSETIPLFNVAGKVEGKRPDEIVLFSAHYDHIGITTAVDGDSIANGANDNASGVAAVIELARYFNAGPQPERTIYFVGFTAEESGGYGSRYFSEQLDPDQIVAMINIEMIGKPAVEGPNSAWITGFSYSDLGEIMQSGIKDSSFIFYPDPYPNQNLFYRSDNATLARLGVPAHSFSTTPIDVDENYHKVSDEFPTIHITHARNTIAAIAKATEVIISGEKTPTRINTEDVD